MAELKINSKKSGNVNRKVVEGASPTQRGAPPQRLTPVGAGRSG
jgi:hypothetical protein